VLTDELRRAQRYRRAISAAVVAIDDFKALNETHGLARGDALLVRVARLLRESVRSVDIVGRYGGEEFLILMPETSHADAWIAAERLRLAVATGIFSGDSRDAAVCESATVSIGLATYPNNTNEMPLFLEQADQALRRANANGRNRIGSAEGAPGGAGLTV
jgi:diguanylate cyclase (GGDEF)-like protein